MSDTAPTETMPEHEADVWAADNGCTFQLIDSFGAEPTARKFRDRQIAKYGGEYLVCDARFGLKPYSVQRVIRPP